MKQSTEKVIRYFIIIILIGIVIYAMTTLVQEQRTIIKEGNKQSSDLQIDELEKPYVLREHTAYGLKVGLTKEQVYGLFSDEKIRLIELFLEGKPTPAMEISIDSQPSLIAELVNGEVYRIRVLDSRFKTQKGIHIGSTLKELERAYSDIIYGSSQGSIFATVRPIQMSFELDDADEVPLEWYKSHDRNLLDDTAEIIEILVF